MIRAPWMRPATVGGSLIVIIVIIVVVINANHGTTRPGAPQNVTATARPDAATVSWDAPVQGGATTYVVTSEPSHDTCSTTGLSCLVSGLRSETSYRFTVVARNGAGTGPPSSESNAVTPAAPAPPTLVVSPAGVLRSGERVTVTGSGFTPDDQVYLVECLRDASGEGGCDVSTATPVTTTSSGHLPATTFTIVAGAIGNSTCGTTPSNRDRCAVSAGNASGGDSAVAPISIAG